jgi:hypothetical protein
MSKASRYNTEWRGYEGKADRLLRYGLERDFYFGSNRHGPDTGPLEREGDWFRIGRVYNVGPKFLRWMVDNGVLEQRNRGTLLDDWYRVKMPDDFGDLWVPDYA